MELAEVGVLTEDDIDHVIAASFNPVCHFTSDASEAREGLLSLKLELHYISLLSQLIIIISVQT